MAPTETGGQSTWMDLDVPRPTSAAERHVLTSLAAVLDEAVLAAQVAGLVVDGVCRCGCSSVRLRTDRPALPAERIAELSGVGRNDYFAVRAGGVAANASVDVVLHVINGRVHELEFFDAEHGEGYPVPVDELTELSDLTVE